MILVESQIVCGTQIAILNLVGRGLRTPLGMILPTVVITQRLTRRVYVRYELFSVCGAVPSDKRDLRARINSTLAVLSKIVLLAQTASEMLT